VLAPQSAPFAPGCVASSRCARIGVIPLSGPESGRRARFDEPYSSTTADASTFAQSVQARWGPFRFLGPRALPKSLGEARARRPACRSSPGARPLGLGSRRASATGQEFGQQSLVDGRPKSLSRDVATMTPGSHGARGKRGATRSDVQLRRPDVAVSIGVPRVPCAALPYGGVRAARSRCADTTDVGSDLGAGNRSAMVLPCRRAWRDRRRTAGRWASPELARRLICKRGCEPRFGPELPTAPRMDAITASAAARRMVRSPTACPDRVGRASVFRTPGRTTTWGKGWLDVKRIQSPRSLPTKLADVLAGLGSVLRARFGSAPATRPASDRRRYEELRDRVERLESVVEGLQDALYRETQRQDDRIAALHARTEPDEIARALSADARKRGL
jgi:hypothetical protein